MRSVQKSLSRLARLSARAISRGRLTRALAGTTIGSRAVGSRGSVLILVLGTLALMTVLAVVYVGIGKGDRQTARAIKTQSESRDVPRQVAEYLAGVIGEDALALTPSYESMANGFPTTALRREAWDATYSDPIYRSNPLLNESNSPNPDPFVDDLGGATPDDLRTEFLRFRPSGTHPLLIDDVSILGAGVVSAIRGAIDFDRRVGSDPFLASPEAVNLDQHLPPNERDDGNLPDPPVHPNVNQTEAQLAWYYNRDILQMSNFAPDGRAVNIWNLAPVVGNQRVSRFDAPSATGDVAGSISSNLTLFGDIFEPYTAGDQQLLWDNQTEADFNRPDHWFVNQRGAFRAMSDVDRGWSEPEFLFYQYADADGDGMVDSRWIELIDATDPANPIPILEHDGRFRYFVAAHAEDLSGRVNVNVAKSGAAPPTRSEPAGFTPADIHLARILSLEDAWADTVWAYSGLEPPRLESGGIDVDSPENYAAYDPTNTQTGSFLLQHVGQAGYDTMQAALLLGVVPPEDVVIELDPGNQPDLLYRYVNTDFGLDVLRLNQDGRERLIPSSPIAWRHSPLGRTHEFAVRSAGGVGASYADPLGRGNSRLITTGAFGLDALAELLTYNGVNDPAVTSDLEAAVGGRYDGDNGSFENFFTLNLDPLRLNRSLLVERGDHDAFDTLSSGGGIGGGGGVNGSPDGITDADAMLLAAVDARRRITTASWARPMQSSIVGRPWIPVNEPFIPADDPLSLRHLTEEQATDLQRFAFNNDQRGVFVPAGSELRTHINDMTILERASWGSGSAGYFDQNGLVFVPLLDNPKAVFELYADALLPYSGVIGSWPTGGIGGGASSLGASTLHYGYRGAEFALRTSAHMALNLIDAMDADDIPTAATLLIDEQEFDRLDLDEERQPDQRSNAWAFWASAPDAEDAGRRIVGMKLDLNRDRNGDGDRGGENSPADPEARLANSAGRTNEQPEAAAVNVFGIEAQPFITEVSTMFAYHDTPPTVRSGNPNLDAGDDDIDDINANPPSVDNVVTINFSTRSRNPDFLFWVIAVQLTNPFDEPVKIGRYVGDPRDPDDRDGLYYLELNGNHFPLAGVPLDCYDYSRQECLGDPDSRIGGGPGDSGRQANELWSNPGIVIRPGESKVFVIPSQPLWFIEDRLEHRLQGSYDATRKDITQIGAILETQFGAPDPAPGNDDARLGEDRSNVVILDPIPQGFDMTFAPFPKARYPGAQIEGTDDSTMLRFEELMRAPEGQILGDEIPYELRLWRVMRQNSIAISQSRPDTLLKPVDEFGGSGDATNLLENDLLVDRMHIDVDQRTGGGGGMGGGGSANPWFAVLDRRLNDPFSPDFEEIDNAFTWNGEDSGDVNSMETFDGLALVSYATVSRPQDEAPNGEAMPLRVPWYALEAKHRWRNWGGTQGVDWNTVDFEGADQGINGRRRGWQGFPDVDDRSNLDQHLYDPEGDYQVGNVRKPLAFVRRFDQSTGQLCRTGFETLVRVLGNDYDFLDEGVPPGCASVDQSDLYRATTTGLPILEKDDTGRDLANGGRNLAFLGGLSVEDLALELAQNIDRDSLRPGDFLLPVGVGAVYDPDLANGGANPQWTTLSEMLARVLGFDNRTDEDGNGAFDDDIYAGVGAIDKQADLATSGATNEFGAPGSRRPVRDPSDPLIGRSPLDKGHIVLDDFVPFIDADPGTVIDRFDPTKGDIAFGMRLPPAIVLLERVRTLFGDPAVGPNALDGTVAGAVNLNTATRTVLRALPMLSPSRIDWWGEELNHDRSSDIASTVQAYRDKIALHFRDPGGVIPFTGLMIDFAEPDADEFNTQDTPRQNVTLVSGLPEQRGMRSVGELALMHSLGLANGNGRPTPIFNAIRNHNIDRLGFDGETFEAVEGVETVRYGRHVGSVREVSGPGVILGDLGLDDRDHLEDRDGDGQPDDPTAGYLNWTLTFIATDDPDLLGRSFHVSDYTGNDPQRRTAREIRYIFPPGPQPTPSEGDVFVLHRAIQGTVSVFDPDTDAALLIASGGFAPGVDYNGSTITFYGAGTNAGRTYNVDSSRFFADGRVELTLQSPVLFDPGDERPVVGNSFVLRPPDYGDDLPANTIAEDDRIDDEFDERLAIINSVINTASVRSDLYAVWFLLHGYQESDVRGLAADDPMLPTIQRRFVMVVDRSNVKAKGDKPEILLFKEVPL